MSMQYCAEILQNLSLWFSPFRSWRSKHFFLLQYSPHQEHRQYKRSMQLISQRNHFRASRKQVHLGFTSIVSTGLIAVQKQIQKRTWMASLNLVLFSRGILLLFEFTTQKHITITNVNFLNEFKKKQQQKKNDQPI